MACRWGEKMEPQPWKKKSCRPKKARKRGLDEVARQDFARSGS